MKSLILLSGGIDSTVALAHTKAELALSVNYGQRHRRELHAAAAVAKYYDVEHHEVNVAAALDIPCALTGHGPIPERHATEPDATVVPGRNLMLISIAVAWAQAWGYGAVVVGANADDHAGYPDCRTDFVHKLDGATRAGYGVTLWAPFVRMSKQDIVTLGRSLHVPLAMTWSCYRGGADPCNRCGACESRNEALCTA